VVTGAVNGTATVWVAFGLAKVVTGPPTCPLKMPPPAPSRPPKPPCPALAVCTVAVSFGAAAAAAAANAPDLYIPLARAQALTSGPGGDAKNKVNIIYVKAASAADVGTVTGEISRLLPSATVTNSASLANGVAGSLKTTGQLARSLGTWLAVLVLLAAVAVASLLTLAAVARRVREFGTLKALGWRSARITAQVMGETLAMGIAGAAAGIALGLAGGCPAPGGRSRSA